MASVSCTLSYSGVFNKYKSSTPSTSYESRAKTVSNSPVVTRPGRISLGRSNTKRDVIVRAENPLADAFEGWLDLTALVSTTSEGSTAGELAEKIGDELYADINGWHLYVRDMKLQNPIAAEVANQLAAGAAPRSAVSSTLARVPVRLGQGKKTLALAELVPDSCLNNTVRAVEDYVEGGDDDW